MRLTVCLEGNAEGRVLASVDMEEIVKMTITDDIEKSNFNPQMLKSCTDTAYESGYQKGRADVIDERASLLAFICKKYDIPLIDMNCTVDEWEQLKEQKGTRI